MKNDTGIKVKRFVKKLFKRKLVIFAAILVVFFVVTAIFAPLLTPYDPYKGDFRQILA